MSKKTVKFLSYIFILLLFFLSGCSKSEDNQTITISGSSAILPLIENTIDGFEKKENYIINAQAGGSGTGITQVYDEIVDIGMSDVLAEDKLDHNKAEALFDNKIAVQGFAIVVNNSLDINNLSTDDIKKIFSGQITNWKDVGGTDIDIFVVHRAPSSGTRAAFTNTVLGGDNSLQNDSIGAVQDSNGATIKSLKQNKGAISYVSFSYLQLEETKKYIHDVSIDGIRGNNKNIITGLYPFYSYAHLYTKSIPQSKESKFINYIKSEENISKVYEVGFIPMSEMESK